MVTAEPSSTRGYAGDLRSADAWALLENDPGSVLIDVRTAAEWAYVGVPDLSRHGKDVLLIEWQTYPSMAVDPQFASRLKAVLAEKGDRPDRPLLFLCRSGVRSRSAAIAATAAGYSKCLNIEDGFEGNLDSERHRGRTSGWKAGGLPWIQS